MANEITLSASLSSSQGGQTIEKAYGGINQNMAATTGYYRSGFQTFSTSEEALVTLEAGTTGYLLMKNLSTTAAEIVNIRNGSGGAVVVGVPAGGIALFKMASGATLWGVAASGTPTLEITIIEA